MAKRCCVCGTANAIVFCDKCRPTVDYRAPPEDMLDYYLAITWAADRARKAERRRQKARRDG
jgi:hypothetical protein